MVDRSEGLDARSSANRTGGANAVTRPRSLGIDAAVDGAEPDQEQRNRKHDKDSHAGDIRPSVSGYQVDHVTYCTQVTAAPIVLVVGLRG